MVRAYLCDWWFDTERSLAAAVEEMPAGYDQLMIPVRGMIWSFGAAAVAALVLTLILSVGWLKVLLLILSLVLAGVTVWTLLMYRVFSYDGKRQMSRQIIDGVAEGVADRTSFAQGDVQKLNFPDETFDAVASNYVYHNIPSRD